MNKKLQFIGLLQSVRMGNDHHRHCEGRQARGNPPVQSNNLHSSNIMGIIPHMPFIATIWSGTLLPGDCHVGFASSQ